MWKRAARCSKSMSFFFPPSLNLSSCANLFSKHLFIEEREGNVFQHEMDLQARVSCQSMAETVIACSSQTSCSSAQPHSNAFCFLMMCRFLMLAQNSKFAGMSHSIIQSERASSHIVVSEGRVSTQFERPITPTFVS